MIWLMAVIKAVVRFCLSYHMIFEEFRVIFKIFLFEARTDLFMGE